MKILSGIVWVCSSCGGRSVTISLLRKNIPREVVNFIWQTARNTEGRRQRKCPACSKKMVEIPVQGTDHTVLIDVCTSCQCVWFDRKELEAIPHLAPPPKTGDAALSQEAREKLAIARVKMMGDHTEEGGPSVPAGWWKYVLAALGLPDEAKSPAVKRFPVATCLTALAVTVVSIIAFWKLDEMAAKYGMIPAEIMRYGGMTMITSFFLHVGPLHLIGNMYFFLLFGDNVEDVLGSLKFMLLLFLATACGDILHVLGDMNSTIPCIGASGGISGILAFYALSFPRARIGIFIWFNYAQLPAFTWLVIWIAYQVSGVFSQIAGYSHVSYLAHLGGAMVGFLFWFLTTRKF